MNMLACFCAKAVEENRHIAQPAFDLQQAIRRKVLGIKYWEKKAKKRTEMFANYDQVWRCDAMAWHWGRYE